MEIQTSCPVVKLHAAPFVVNTTYHMVLNTLPTHYTCTFVVACLLRYAAAHLTSWDL